MAPEPNLWDLAATPSIEKGLAGAFIRVFRPKIRRKLYPQVIHRQSPFGDIIILKIIS